MWDKATKEYWLKVFPLQIIPLNLFLIALAVLALVMAEYPGQHDGYLLTRVWRTLLTVAGSVLGVSLTGDLLYRAFFGPSDKQERFTEMRQAVREAFDQHYTAENRYGLVGFIQQMDFESLFDGLGKGDELWWHDTFAPTLSGWEAKLRLALDRGASIQMLVQNPDCQNAKYRAEEIGGYFTEANYLEELRRFRDHLAGVSKLYQTKPGAGRLVVRQYADLPSVPMYIICQQGTPVRGYSSFFLTAATGNDFPHLVWGPSEANLLTMFLTFVGDKWRRASPIP